MVEIWTTCGDMYGKEHNINDFKEIIEGLRVVGTVVRLVNIIIPNKSNESIHLANQRYAKVFESFDNFHMTSIRFDSEFDYPKLFKAAYSDLCFPLSIHFPIHDNTKKQSGETYFFFL